MDPAKDTDFRLSYNYRLPGLGLARVGKKTALPREFTARLEYPLDHTVEMDVVVEDGVPKCHELRVVRNPAVGWLNGTELRRFPLQRWLEFVCANVGMVVETQGPDNHLIRPASARDSDGVYADVQTATRRRTIDDDFLREVAAAYRSGGVKSVQSEFPSSDSQAFRWVKKARERGFLPERQA